MRAAWMAVVVMVGSLLAGFVAPASAADAVRCAGHLVERGDPAIDVRHYCGEPTFVDPWTGSGALAYGVSFDMEAWTYNRGPGRLIQIIVFRNGKVESIENAGYGFQPGQSQIGCSRAGAIAGGMSKYRLLVSCGEPDQRSGGFILSSRFSGGGQEYYLSRGIFPVYRETWIYNFGASRLQREVTLENGRVVSVDTLGRGFDR
ncbi:MAG: DUF2845 domain-containing protein [Salinisphaera sp.]|jgi:hypothetical protein|nr:DUF2845 domain-containing protein [Salinisphaera sp.]